MASTFESTNPAFTSLRSPKPPLAITGTDVFLVTVVSNSVSNPLPVPSWSIDVIKISPHPRSVASFTQF